jgi:hypothetical protein
LDESIRNAQDSHLAAEKQEVTDAWNKWLATKRAAIESDDHVQKVRKIMRGRYPGWTGDNAAGDVVETQVEVEEVISVVEEPLSMVR